MQENIFCTRHSINVFFLIFSGNLQKITYYLFNSLQLYVCGGFSGSECLSTAECYNPEADQWTVIASMGIRRSGIGVIAFANQIFAVSTLNTADTHITQKQLV